MLPAPARCHVQHLHGNIWTSSREVLLLGAQPHYITQHAPLYSTPSWSWVHGAQQEEPRERNWTRLSFRTRTQPESDGNKMCLEVMGLGQGEGVPAKTYSTPLVQLAEVEKVRSRKMTSLCGKCGGNVPLCSPVKYTRG